MAYIASDITTKVQQRVRDPGYSTAEIKNYLNDTQNDVFNEYRLPFMRASQTYTVTSGVADITNGANLPTNFVEVIKLVNTTGGQESEIANIDENLLDAMYPDRTDTTLYPNGNPQYWYYDGSTIRLFPAPAGAYTLTLRYWKRPTLLSADADIPSIPSEFEEILVVGAAYRVFQVVGNWQEAGILQNKYDELLQKLVMRYSADQTGRVHQMAINRTSHASNRLGSQSIDSIRRIP